VFFRDVLICSFDNVLMQLIFWPGAKEPGIVFFPVKIIRTAIKIPD
jgi:hypothetical protein